MGALQVPLKPPRHIHSSSPRPASSYASRKVYQRPRTLSGLLARYTPKRAFGRFTKVARRSSLAVVASITCVTPTERIKTALIDDARNERRYRSMMHCVRVVFKEEGMLGLYRGFAGTTLKQAGATAFRMGTYNILKDYERSRNISQSTLTNFANGSVAGIVTTFATQPFDTIKTRCQSSRGASTVEAFKSVVADYGVRGFWKGTTMRLGRTVFSGGILFTSYEWAAALLQPLVVPKQENLRG